MAKYNFIKTLAKNDVIVPQINAYIAANGFPVIEVDSFKAGDKYFHPSGDCTPCVRELYAKFSGDADPEVLTHKSHKNFWVGHFWHASLQEIFQRLGYCDSRGIEIKCSAWRDEGTGAVVQQEGPVIPDSALWGARGSADAVLAIPHRDEPIMIDIKTMNSRYWIQDPLPEWLLRKWRYQVNCYMAWTGVDRALILGVQKDSPHDFREIPIERDPSLVEECYEKWTTVAKALKDGIVPTCNCPDGKCEVGWLYENIGN